MAILVNYTCKECGPFTVIHDSPRKRNKFCECGCKAKYLGPETWDLLEPDWICSDCGTRYGKGSGGQEATMHNGHCGICGKEGPVTEPRDFGHLKPGWMDVVRKRLAKV